MNEIGTKNCDQYFELTIAPQWRARAEAIAYCTDVGKDLRKSVVAGTTNQEQFDLRLDPYAVKNDAQKIRERYEKCDEIDFWTLNERGVELILREQTRLVLADKCEYRDWVAEFKRVLSSKN